ncbi:MAG: hypothetical protein ACERIH_05275 [Labilibaculum antarcticum]
MLNEKTLRKRINDLKAMPFNLKAEIIASQLYDRGVTSENLTIHMNSSFNRPFRRDVEKAQLGIDDEWDQVTLLLSRNGIYDLLPEGVVHESNQGNGKENIQQLIQHHQKQKREEKEARLFFKPFENELFAILVRIERQEADLLKNQDRQFQSFLIRFWDINQDLTDSQKQFLLKVAPLAYSVKGNIAKICKILQVFLSKPVSYKRVYSCVISNILQKNKEIILGHNFIVGNSTEELPSIQFQVEGVKENEVKDYLKGGFIHKFIMEFLEYLLPAEYELEVICKTNRSYTPIGFGVLGYSSVLNS